MFTIYIGTGMKVPDQARAALMGGQQEPAPPPQRVNVARRQEREDQSMPPIATQCFMLSNMFDPINEREPAWDQVLFLRLINRDAMFDDIQEIRDDVVEECNKHGGVVHIYVDKASPQGNVYVKCPSINCAVAAVNALHGRWFAGAHTIGYLSYILSALLFIRKSYYCCVCARGELPQPFPRFSQPNHADTAEEIIDYIDIAEDDNKDHQKIIGCKCLKNKLYNKTCCRVIAVFLPVIYTSELFSENVTK